MATSVRMDQDQDQGKSKSKGKGARVTAVYANTAYEKFRCEAQRAGFAVIHYRGPDFFEGPAVVIGTMEGAERLIAAVTGVLQFDRMATIWYPEG